jgi:HSP20 family molecular chaperone IbpA
MVETDEAILIDVELPGVKREDVHLEVGIRSSTLLGNGALRHSDKDAIITIWNRTMIKG